MKEVTIFDIVEIADDRCVVFLVDKETDRYVPITIGPAEGYALVCGLRDIPVIRPLSHDLMASIVQELDGTLREARIERLVDCTFYAVLCLLRPDGTHQIDCRPSDALCLAARLRAPIYLANELFHMAEGEKGTPITMKNGSDTIRVDGTGIDTFAAHIRQSFGAPR